jgi:hypothetical protein
LHWVGVFVHEAGHAGFGLAQGMTLKQFAVGPLLIDWSKGPAQVRNNGLRGLNGGYVRFSGDNVGTNNSVRAHFWMTFGGPVSSLLLGIILLEMGSLMSGDSGWLKYGFIFSGFWAIAVAVINLIPLRNGLTRSDGSWLLALARDGDDARELVAAIYWMDLLHSLTPPAKWPFEIVQTQEDALFRSTTLTENQLDLAIVAAVMLYYHHADREDWIEANRVMTKAADLPRLPERFPVNSRFDALDALRAAHLALRGQNPVGARTALEWVHPRSLMCRSSLYIGSVGSVALLQGDAVTALELTSVARNLLTPSLTYVAADQIEDSWWAEVNMEARKLLPAAGLVPQEVGKPMKISGVAAGIASRDDLFAWDPGVPSDLRSVWTWREPVQELELSA